MIKFLERETTDQIALLFKPEWEKLSVEEIEIEQKRKGNFNLGFHFILRKNGEIDEGIDHKIYGDVDVYGYKTSILVAVTSKALSKKQQGTLDNLKALYNLPVVVTKYE